MNRKILNNNKSKRLNGFSKGKIGEPLGIFDKNGRELFVGDKIRYGKYIGRILFNGTYELMLSYSLWYGYDEYNVKSYGKSITIPLDNGGRMEMEYIKE